MKKPFGLNKRQLNSLTRGAPWWGRVLVLVVIGVGWWWMGVAAEDPESTTPPPAASEVEEGWFEVDLVVDGDTVRVLTAAGSQAVRLIGVDTPEVVDPRRPVQCFGQEASEAAKELLEGEKVRLVSDESQGAVDRYGRWLRYVYLADGRMVNLVLLQEGFGHEYTYRTPYIYQDQFKKAEAEARQEGLGLWAESACLSEMNQ